ncbi:hypothetical protein K466DRAFT_581268 [Polyporus arcularius HHB13444]|uniref:Uncharacterized protein n=1 Tax=Polyporus arcularius HHB13444 TaxID=1314778 RepID=A0A5C3PTS5_9APHY|nr:hypothetical protein K466DRAFT_581268 [Polyporus arcularius HHB13444]
MSETFSTAGLLGFAGSEEHLGATQVAHILGRKLLPSAYNSPGSYAAGKGYSALAKSRVFDGLHPGVSSDPSTLSQGPNTDSASGPKYTAAFSGTIIPHTGPIAKALMDRSKTLAVNVVEGRVTTPSSVTVVELPDAPDSEVHPVAKVHAPVILPIAASAAAAAACGVIGDWKTSMMIVAGMVCNGVASSSLKQGDLTFTRPVTTPGAPAGDGYLENGTEFIVLKGTESAVASVTRGRFSLRFRDEGSHQRLRTSSTLLTVQCFVQLLLVPQGTILGQFIFLLSMAISWLYNAYVSRQEQIAWERLALEDLLKAPSMKRHSLGTRTTTAVFLMQVLQPANIEEQLALLLPNNTPVWRFWRQTVAKRLREEKPDFDHVQLDDGHTFSSDEIKLLGTLLGDAQAAVDGCAKLSGSKF